MLNGRLETIAWSPDGRTLVIVKGEQISSISIADGQSQSLVNAPDLGAQCPGPRLLRWSPDGKTLAFWATTTDEAGRGMRIFLFHSADGHVTKVADGGGFYFWSPDSQWISYGGTQRVKIRSAGVLWEMDIDEAVTKLAK
jgi:Tol biopolymer transport system component